MTKPEMRIAIAEACGWQHWKSTNGKVSLKKPDERTASYWASVGCVITSDELTQPISEDVPNYPEDLNAMREVELSLTDEQYRAFNHALVGSRNDPCMPICKCKSASAEERAAAVVRALGKWKE